PAPPYPSGAPCAWQFAQYAYYLALVSERAVLDHAGGHRVRHAGVGELAHDVIQPRNAHVDDQSGGAAHESLPVGLGAILGVRRYEGDAACEAAVRDRDAERRRHADAGSDARNHLDLDASGDERLHFLAAAPEDERITAL